MTSIDRVLIAGCGYVGCALGKQLVAAGHAVFGLRRDPTALPADIQPVVADLTDPTSLQTLPDDVDVVVYAASAGGFREESYQRAYVDGLNNLISALQTQQQQPRLLLFTSSTAVYHQQDEEWVDEQSPTLPSGFSGATVLRGERLVQSAPWPSSVVRLAGIYGPGRTRFLERVRRGEAPIPTRPRWTNRIHRDDCAGILHFLIEKSRENPVESLYVGIDNEPVTQDTIITWLADAMQAPTPPPEGEPRSGLRPVTNKRCSNARIRALGYQFVYPTFREGYGQVMGASPDRS